MKKEIGVMVGLIFFATLILPVKVSGQQIGENDAALKAAEGHLKERAIASGTLDIFDESNNQVRNLRLVEVHDKVIEEAGKYLVLAEYRDVNTGDIVTVEVDMVSGEAGFVVETLRIKEIKALSEGKEQEAKDYSDSEIQAFMVDYIERQGRFSDGNIMLFDKENDKMRNLKLTELKEEVRRMGTFYNSSSTFTDVDTGDILDIDISVENQKGKLKIQALRIRDVHKKPSS